VAKKHANRRKKKKKKRKRKRIGNARGSTILLCRDLEVAYRICHS
jgi:hypothetical protein